MADNGMKRKRSGSDSTPDTVEGGRKRPSPKSQSLVVGRAARTETDGKDDTNDQGGDHAPQSDSSMTPSAVEQGNGGVDAESKLLSSGSEDGEPSSTAKDGGNSVRNSGDVKIGTEDPIEGVAAAQAADHVENGQSVQDPHALAPSDTNRDEHRRPSQTSPQGPASTSVRPQAAPQFAACDLYNLEDVNTLLSLYAAEINRFWDTYEAGIMVGYAAWNNDDGSVDFLDMIIHEWENLARQRDLLQARAEIPRPVSWPDLVDRKVRMPFVMPRGLPENADDYIMDVEKTLDMPDGVWEAFNAMFKTHTLEGAKLAGYYLLEQIKWLKKSPFHYQERGVWGGEEKSWFLASIEAKIEELEYLVGHLTLEAMRAGDIPELVKVVQPKLINGGHGSQGTTAGISAASSTRKESKPATKIVPKSILAGDGIAIKKPEGRESNVKPKTVRFALSSANSMPVAPNARNAGSTHNQAGEVATDKESEGRKRKASPPINAPTGPKAWKKQRVE